MTTHNTMNGNGSMNINGNEASDTATATKNTGNGSAAPCFVKEVCNELDYPYCPFCSSHQQEGAEGAGIDAKATKATISTGRPVRMGASDTATEGARVGTITDAISEPTISKAKGNRKAKPSKSITDKQRTFIDRWLEKLFDLNNYDHLRVLAKLTETGISKKGNRLLHDAAERGNWQASALWLELHHPEHWAPNLKNIIFIGSDHSGKSYRKDRKAGRQNGTSNEV